MTLPPARGGTDEEIPLERRVLLLWRIRGTLVVLPAAAAAVVSAAISIPLPAALVMGVTVLGLVGGLMLWWTALAWRRWRFAVGAEALHLRRGVLTRKASTIPYHRVQHIDLEAGPLERRLGLTSLILRTAAATSDSTVPGIDAADAEAIRARILALVGTGDAT